MGNHFRMESLPVVAQTNPRTLRFKMWKNISSFSISIVESRKVCNMFSESFHIRMSIGSWVPLKTSLQML